MSIEKLLKGVSESAKDFVENKPESVKIVCHRGTDGIIGASLLIKLFSKLKIDFCVSTLKMLDYQSLVQLSIEPYKDYIFVGFGTESLKNIDEILNKKNVLVFDHHTPKSTKSSKTVLCPSFFGIKSYKEITSSGLVYLFCSSIEKSFESSAWLPVVSIFSEYSNTDNLSEINRSILNVAVNNKSINLTRGLKDLTLQNFPVHQALCLSVEPYFPGISSNTEGAVDFLNGLGISIRKEGSSNYKLLADLNEDDARRLATSLIIERLGSSKEKESFFGEMYVLSNPEVPVSDLKGFAILLKACSYLNCPSTAIALCLEEYNIKEKALGLLEEYVAEIVSALNWFYKEIKSKSKEEDNFVFFNAESVIKENTLSSVVSLIARSNVYRPGFVIIGCCHTFDEKLKVSTRVVDSESSSVDLLNILKIIAKKLESGSVGGHKNAAGATIDLKFEKDFETVSLEILKKKAVEETII
jgi:single-stranded-DNA-specific exonuclease